MDGKLVGFSLFCFVYYTWVGNSIYLDDLYVKPEARGRGIGSRLMKVKENTPNHIVARHMLEKSFQIVYWMKYNI